MMHIPPEQRQIGSRDNIYYQAESLDVANFLRNQNIYDTTVTASASDGSLQMGDSITGAPCVISALLLAMNFRSVCADTVYGQSRRRLMMLPYKDALNSVLETVQSLTPCEILTADAGGLILAEAVKAHWDMPRCDNSAMDGYAIAGESSAEGSNAMPPPLEIIGASYAGHPFFETVPAGQSIRITTGAALPNGADTVIPVEDAKEEDGRLCIQTTFSAGQHVRLQGEEFQAGVQLLQAGTLLKAGEISLLASAGVDRVKVYPRPRVAIISTGDELIELGETPRPDQVVNSNLHFLTTRLQECGCEPVCIGIGKDDTASLDQFIAQALDADLIISTGGVSVGEKDHERASWYCRRPVGNYLAPSFYPVSFTNDYPVEFVEYPDYLHLGNWVICFSGGTRGITNTNQTLCPLTIIRND